MISFLHIKSNMCVHPEREDHPIMFQRSDDEEEEQRGEEERCGKEAENVREGAQ
jgi:hypothetical protein